MVLAFRVDLGPASRIMFVNPCVFVKATLAGVYLPNTPSRGRHSCLTGFAMADTAAAPARELNNVLRFISDKCIARAERKLEALIRGVATIYATDPQYATQLLATVPQANVQQALARA
jgi:hypothetical protein